MSEFSSSADKKYRVGVVGCTGAVGIEVIQCLWKCQFPVQTLHVYASSKSAGKTMSTTGYGGVVIEEFDVESCRSHCDVVFLAVSGEFALKYAPLLVANDGPYVIDNSSAFRYDADIPLIVPEINAHVLSSSKSRLIANPNCTTAIAAVALYPLHQVFTIKTLIVSTYQAASGAGAEGMQELLSGTKAFLNDEKVTNQVFVHPLPFNLIPHIDKFQDNGYTKEEMKVVWETKKIFGVSEEEIRISCTAVRIPTLRAHSESITLETVKEINVESARQLLQSAQGVRLVDSPLDAQYPMPLTATSSFDVEVGRIRQSLVFGKHGLELFVCGDQLLRGAALNAVLIAKKLIELDLI